MSTPPPNSPWGQPAQPGQPQQPPPAPAGPPPGQWPPATPTVPVVATPGGGGGGKKTLAIVIAVVAAVAIGVVGGLALLGGDDDDSSNNDRDRTEERDDRDDRPSDEGDPEDAVDVARDLVQALIDGDCGRVADLATDDYFDNELEADCGETNDGAELHDAELTSDDPVVVTVIVESDDGGDDGISELPLEMIYEDGDWLVDSFYFDEPDIDVPTDDTIEVPRTSVSIPDDDSLPPASVSNDPEQTAEQAIQAVIDGDCATILSLATLNFIEAHSEEVCSGELLPPDATITGVETIGDDPLVVSVDVDAAGESFGIELTFADELGILLIDDYSV